MTTAEILDRVFEIRKQLHSFALANSAEAKRCIVGEELRKAAYQSAAQCYTVAAQFLQQLVIDYIADIPKKKEQDHAAA